jgi:DNA ligase-1
MQLAELVATSSAVAGARGRKDKSAKLAALLARLGADEYIPAVAWLCGRLPQGKIGVGWALLRSLPEGDVPPSLTIGEVDAAFAAIGALSGSGSAEARRAQLASLWARASAAEREFLARVLIGEVRQGSLDGVMGEAVALAAGLPADEVRRAAMLAGDLPTVAAAALAGEGLGAFTLQLFRPVEPMLASPCENVEEALAELGEAAFEWKLDGARVQVHKDGDQVRLYTRGLADVTASLPEVVEAVRALPARRLVLDGEVIGLRGAGRPLPFQLTMSRFSRKLVGEGSQRLQPFFFDVLLRDDEVLMDRPARERQAVLDALVPPGQRPPRLITAEVNAAQAFFDDALARGHEGLMAKGLGAAYQVGARGQAWRKLKRAKVLDLVVLAVEQGSGRRSAWLSNLHLGARDPDGGFVMLGKTFKGMTDEMLAWQTEKLGGLAVRREGHIVWVRPELVVEIAFDGVQQSPHYPGGMALRFARVKRYREDKRAEEADTVETVRKIFASDSGNES